MIRLIFSMLQRRLHAGQYRSAFRMIVTTVAILCYASTGYMFFEIHDRPDLTWADAIWWSLVTITTVGYGDFFPQTFWGRFAVGVPTMIFGVSILGYLLSVLATALVEAKGKALKGMKSIRAKGHVLLVHFSDVRRIQSLVDNLREDPTTAKKPLVLIDNELEELPAPLSALGILFVRGNPARERTLVQANISEATHAIVLSKDPNDVRSDDLNVAVAMTIEVLKPEVLTVAECVDPEAVEVLRRTGCDAVVCVSRLSSSMLVQELLDPGAQDVFEELSTLASGQQVYICAIESMGTWSVQSLREHVLTQGTLLLGLRRKNGHVELNPDADVRVEEGDSAVVIAKRRPAPFRVP